MTNPTISIVLINYNHEEYLRSSLESILTQSPPADEVIIVDDGSTDNSVNLAKNIANGISYVTIISNKTNLGALAATNKGLAMAQGDYIGLFNSDNQLLPGFIEQAKTLIGAHPGIGVITSETEVWIAGENQADRTHYFDLKTLKWNSKGHCVLTGSEIQQALQQTYLWFATSGVLMRRDAVLKIGGMLYDLDWLSDWFAVYGVALRHGAGLINQPKSIMRENCNSYGKLASGNPFRRRSALDALFRRLNTKEFIDLRDKMQRMPILILTPLGFQSFSSIFRNIVSWGFLPLLLWHQCKLCIGKLISKRLS